MIFLIKFKHTETNFLRLFYAVHVEETMRVKKIMNAQDIFNELERKSKDGRSNDSY